MKEQKHQGANNSELRATETGRGRSSPQKLGFRYCWLRTTVACHTNVGPRVIQRPSYATSFMGQRQEGRVPCTGGILVNGCGWVGQLFCLGPTAGGFHTSSTDQGVRSTEGGDPSPRARTTKPTAEAHPSINYSLTEAQGTQTLTLFLKGGEEESV